MIDHIDESYSLEDTKKFLPKNEESKLKNGRTKFTGLTKDEVLAYSDDPDWVKLRWILFGLFWFVWLALLVSAAAIVFTANSCPPRPKMDWWQKEIVYQVDVERFRDSNGDGVGDLDGVLEKSYHFKDMSIKAVNLRSNVLSAENPKEFAKKFDSQSKNLKELKKAFKREDLYLILDIPYKLASENDTKVLSFWLEQLDGVRVTEVPADADKAKLNELIELAAKVGKETFTNKFIAFHPYNPVEALQKPDKPSTIFKSVFSQNPFASQETKANFMNQFINQTESVWTSILTSDYSSSRLSTVITNKKQLEAAHAMILLLKNTPFVLYGDELEMQTKNGFMKWDRSLKCGFSSNKSVDIGTGDCSNSANDLTSHGAGHNLVRMYKDLAELKKEPSFQWGTVKFNSAIGNVVSFVRKAVGFDGYLVAANVAGVSSGSIDFESLHDIPNNGTVEYLYADDLTSIKELGAGSQVMTGKIILKPGELLVVRFDDVVKKTD